MNRVEFLLPWDYSTIIRKCKACNADIVWIITGTGARMPITVASIEYRNGEPYGESHFAACPFAGDYRRKVS